MYYSESSVLSERGLIYSGLPINVFRIKWGGMEQNRTERDHDYLFSPKILICSKTKEEINVGLQECSVI